jgi:hypothetical protein
MGLETDSDSLIGKHAAFVESCGNPQQMASRLFHTRFASSVTGPGYSISPGWLQQSPYQGLAFITIRTGQAQNL